MASISDTLVNSALKQATGDQAQAGVESMTKLGEHIQNTQIKRQEVEAQKAKLADAKLTNFVGAIEKGRKFSGPARNNYYKNFLPKYRDSLGLNEMFPDESLAFSLSADSDLARMATIRSKIQRREISAEQGVQMWLNPTELADVPPTLSKEIADEFAEAERSAEGFNAQAMNTQAKINASASAATIADQRTRERAQEQIINKSYDKFIGEGGVTTLSSNLNSFKGAINDIARGKVKLGKFKATAASMAGDTIQDVFDKPTAQLRDKIFNAVVGSLRPILGAQFAQKEGERILSLSFNPRFSNEENMRKLGFESSKLEDRIASSLKYYLNAGKLKDVDIPGEFQERVGLAKASDPAKEVARVKAYDAVLNNVIKEIKANPKINDADLIKRLSAKMPQDAAEALVMQARGSK